MRPSARRRVLDATQALAGRHEAFTLGEVAAQARVSRATVHRLFGSRDALLAELHVEPELDSRERVLRAAGELLTQHSLDTLSMEEVAERAGVSRANLYRLFPGKPALFRELVRAYSPLEPVKAVLEAMADRPPEEVMPAIARAAAARLAGKTGLVRSLLSEVSRLTPDTEEARLLAISEGIGPAIAYLVGQMAASRLRPMHPLLAIQSFIGPIAFHLLTRDVAHRIAGYDQPLETAIDELVAIWLRGMAVEQGGAS